jgi:lysophospholipase L1-like esterase
MSRINLVLLLIALAGYSGKTMKTLQLELPQITVDTQHAGNGQDIAYLALGDSYTIGESVPARQSFPYQLSGALNQLNYKVADPVIIARTGWTTGELIDAIKAQSLTHKFDFVTLLIGVNNQYRHYNINTYRTEFVQLLQTALTYAKGSNKKVFVLSIPDWGVSPFAKGQDVAQIAKEINEYNTIAEEESKRAGISFTNITTISRRAANDASLVAPDGLHPSGKMYTLWVQQLVNNVAKNLK